MSGYIASFTFYTLAIIGVLLAGYVIVKKALISNGISNSKNQFLNIEQSMNIAPRKTLHIVRAGNEKFLIAADAERTSFLTKLAVDAINQEQEEIVTVDIDSKNERTQNPNKSSIMRSILEKIEI